MCVSCASVSRKNERCKWCDSQVNGKKIVFAKNCPLIGVFLSDIGLPAFDTLTVSLTCGSAF